MLGLGGGRIDGAGGHWGAAGSACVWTGAGLLQERS